MKRANGLILMVLCLTGVRAVEPEHVTLDTYEELAQGNLRSTSLGDDGVLRPAPLIRKMSEIKPSQIWSSVVDKDGSIWLGTGPTGELLKMQPEGKVETISKFTETHLYAMARHPKGGIFVATSPDGKIFRVEKDKKPKVYFQTKEKYVWDLLCDESGVLYAATGTEGRIYKITGQDQGEVYYDSDEIHLRCLAWDGEKRLLAGSADSGILYRITGQNQAVAVASTGKQEVNRIAVLKDGTIFFSATGRSKAVPPKSQYPAAGGGASTGLRSLALAAAEGEDASKSAPAGNAPNLQPRKGKANVTSQLYCLDKSGFVRALWGTGETILSLLPQGNEVWVGTGNEGHLYSVDAKGKVTVLGQLEAESLTTLLSASEGSVLASTSNGGAVWALGGTNPNPGVYESDVIDSGSFARWGAIRVGGYGDLSLRTRSGNTPKPDKSWYPWSSVKEDHSQSPPARYLQFEIQIRGGLARRVEFAFQVKNLPPRVRNFEILAPGLGYITLMNPPIPEQAKTADQILSSKKMPDSDSVNHMPLRYQPTERHGLRTLVWKAEDLNDDVLTYSIFYRPEGSKTWLTLVKELTDSVYSWDTTGWPDGRYELKLIVSDEASNPKGEELTDESVHQFLVIDNTPPVVKIVKVTDDQIEFTVSEESGKLDSVRVSTDGQDFVPVRPVDGILDSKWERFVVPIPGKAPFFIRAEDDSGNIGGASVHLKP